MTEARTPPRPYAFAQGGDLVLSDRSDLQEAQSSGRWIRVKEGLEEVRA